MASNSLCRPSRAYSENTGTLPPFAIASRANFNSPRRNERWKSLPLLRITVGARLPLRAQNKPNETFASDSRIGEVQRSVDSHTEVKQFSSIGTAHMPLVSMKEWNLTDKHLFVLSVMACVTGGAVTALFVAAIPTLLAFKRAAESLERLLEVTREELPGTMAAIRLSGMEISDLTMELSDLGQEISSGVKSSARAVRAAQDGLRRVSSIASMGARSSPSRVNEASSSPSSKEST